MRLYDRVADLPLKVDSYDLRFIERNCSGDFARVSVLLSLQDARPATPGFTRPSTRIALHGQGETGYGEDVTYDSDDHRALVNSSIELPLSGTYTLDTFSSALDEVRPVSRADATTRGLPGVSAVGRRERGARSRAQTGRNGPREHPRSGVRPRTVRREHPTQRTRLVRSGRDLASSVSGSRVQTRRDVVMDAGARRRPRGDRRRSRPRSEETVPRRGGRSAGGSSSGLLESFPDALIEDPVLTAETRPLFEGREGRVTWDTPITDVKSVDGLPFEPEWLNVKPSRFGTVESLFDTIEHCSDRGIRMYGGGQTKLSVGREHIHAIASLFYPDAPNDIAPRTYNEPEPASGLPRSPLSPPADHGDSSGNVRHVRGDRSSPEGRSRLRLRRSAGATAP